MQSKAITKQFKKLRRYLKDEEFLTFQCVFSEEFGILNDLEEGKRKKRKIANKCEFLLEVMLSGEFERNNLKTDSDYFVIMSFKNDGFVFEWVNEEDWN